jgi:hypothetical protein
MKLLNWITVILVIVGGLNWGLVAMGYNLVESLVGGIAGAPALVYGLVGLSAIYLLFRIKKLA